MSKISRPIYEFDSFRLDTKEHVLLRNGQPVPLKPKVFDLLVQLVTNSGHILMKDELMKQIWPDSYVEEHNLAVNISALRKVLAGDNEKLYIETVPRRGYRFVAEVRELWEETIHSGFEQGNGLQSLASEAGSGKSIAVLPFKPIGKKASEDQYLGLGMADALITRISNVLEIVVRPTNAVRKYNDSTHDPVRVGSELKVASVLDGSIQRSGHRVRVTVQLVNVADGATIWAEKFDEKFTSIFALEDSISEQVASALTLELTQKLRNKLRKRYTENTVAYQAYLRGRFLLSRRTAESYRSAIVYFKEAIKMDPEYALAYTGVADYYLLLSNLNLITPQESAAKAKDAILKAIELDDSIAEAHLSLAYLRAYSDWDWPDAEREFKRAIELSPNHAETRQFYSIYLRQQGRFEEGLAEIKLAQVLDPVSPNISVSLGSLLFFARRYDEAIAQLRKTIALDPAFVMGHLYLGLTYQQTAMYDEAIASVKNALSLSDNLPEFRAQLGFIYAVAGRQTEARAIVQELLELLKQRYIAPYNLAFLHAGMGDHDEAFFWLEKAYEERSCDLALLSVDPRLDDLRGDTRFMNFVRHVGLKS